MSDDAPGERAHASRMRRIVAALNLVKGMTTEDVEKLVTLHGAFQIMSLERIGEEQQRAFFSGWNACSRTRHEEQNDVDERDAAYMDFQEGHE